MQLAVGKDLMIRCNIPLEASSTDELLGGIERNLRKVKACGYQQLQFEKVSEPLQHRLQALLGT